MISRGRMLDIIKKGSRSGGLKHIAARVQTVHLIYDSIGSCGECVHWQENYWSNKKPYGCSWMEQTFMNKDWFCANFTRK